MHTTPSGVVKQLRYVCGWDVVLEHDRTRRMEMMIPARMTALESIGRATDNSPDPRAVGEVG
jgi:hypothetical protein